MPFMRLDQRTVLGHLAGIGSRDPDVLYAARMDWLARVRLASVGGACIIVLGTLLTLTVVMAPVGAALLAVGWWLWRRGHANRRTVEAAYEEFVNSRGSPA